MKKIILYFGILLVMTCSIIYAANPDTTKPDNSIPSGCEIPGNCELKCYDDRGCVYIDEFGDCWEYLGDEYIPCRTSWDPYDDDCWDCCDDDGDDCCFLQTIRR